MESGAVKLDRRIKPKIESESQEKALNEILILYDDKRLSKIAPHSSDRVELVKTIMNRARDIEKEVKRVELTRAEPDMKQYDPLNKLWTACGYCGNLDISHKGDNGNDWQGCFECRHLLNEDGTTRRMKR